MLHLLSTILLGPILLIQGRYVRATIEMLPEPEGQRAGRSGIGKPLKLLIVGDSAAAGVGAPSQGLGLLGQVINELGVDFEVDYTLLAASGHKTQNCINQLKEFEKTTFDVVVTSLGVNDVTGGCSQSKFLQSQNDLIHLLKDKFSAGQIILSGLPPVSEFPALPQPLRWYLGSQAKRFDRILKHLSEQHRADYIKFEFDDDPSLIASDGFHPGIEVYRHWAGLVADKVRLKTD